ncbi:MAG: VWA domain-containing protein, partial [Planctomycetota bacterium]
MLSRVNTLFAIALAASTLSWQVNTFAADGAQVRVATFTAETSEGPSYFAASIQPSANDQLIEAVKSPQSSVVVVVDTSASQTGPFREDQLAMLRSVISNLSSSDAWMLVAADVKTAAMTTHLRSDNDLDAAIESLEQRLPLGHTNLISAIDGVRAHLVAEPMSRNRSIVYIGDGTSFEGSQHGFRFESLIDALRADRIAIHSLAIGPTTNVAMMGTLANQTGGTVTVVGNARDAIDSIGRFTASAAKSSPIWIQSMNWGDSDVKCVQTDRLPPLRIDRDSIFVGTSKLSDLEGQLTIQGETSTNDISIEADFALEPSHPDFGFLVGLVEQASPNHGLSMPTAGSGLLREVARVMTAKSRELVRAGQMALEQGNAKGAKVIAEEALRADPNNDQAERLRETVAKELIVQNDGGFDDIFGEGGDALGDGEAMQLGDDPLQPFGAEEEPNPFGDQEADAAPPAPTEPAFAAPAAPVAPPADAFAPQAAMPLAPQGSIDDFGNVEVRGDALDRVRQELSVSEGRLKAEVRATIRAAQRQLREDPTGVAGSLKSLLAQVEATPEISPELRQELAGQVRSAIQSAARREAEYNEDIRTLEQINAGASATARLLEETFRREAQLKSLSQQMNALIDEERYEEADGPVSIPFAEIAGDTITRDSVEAQQFLANPLAVKTYAKDRRFT